MCAAKTLSENILQAILSPFCKFTAGKADFDRRENHGRPSHRFRLSLPRNCAIMMTILLLCQTNKLGIKHGLEEEFAAGILTEVEIGTTWEQPRF